MFIAKNKKPLKINLNKKEILLNTLALNALINRKNIITKDLIDKEVNIIFNDEIKEPELELFYLSSGVVISPIGEKINLNYQLTDYDIEKLINEKYQLQNLKTFISARNFTLNLFHYEKLLKGEVVIVEQYKIKLNIYD